jgi:hypothetical protein
MKQYILPGIIAVLAMGLPLAAQAQTSPTFSGGQAAPVITQPSPAPYSSPSGTFANPYQTPSSVTSPYGAQTQSQPLVPSPQMGSQYQAAPPTQTGTQNQNPGMLNSQMGAPASSGVTSQQPSVTQGQSTVQQQSSTSSSVQTSAISPTPSSGEVIVGTDAASSVIPPLTVGMGTTVINVVNPTPKPVSFSIPTLNMTYDVPANAQRTIQIDRTQTANLTPGQVIAYYVNDASGNQIATSSLTNYSAVATQINTNTQVATESQTTPASSSETQTSTVPQNNSRRSTVRGFW